MSSKSPSRRRRRPRSLRRRLPIVILALIVTPAAIFTTLAALHQATREQERVTKQLSEIADLQVQTVQSWVESTQDSLLNSVRDTRIGPVIFMLAGGSEAGTGATEYAIARQEFANYARGITGGNPFDRLDVLDLEGVVRGSSEFQLLNRDLSSEPWFRAAIEASPGTVTVSGPLRDPFDGQESLYFAIAIHNEGGDLVGVLSGRTSQAALQETLYHLPPPGETGEFYLVREGQQYVTPPRYPTDTPLATGEIVTTVLNGEDGTGVWRDYRGKRVIGAYRWIEPPGMALIVKQDLEEALADSRALLGFNLVAGALTTAFALVVGITIARRMSGQLEDLNKMVTRVAQGDLTLHVPEMNVLEFDQVARSFNSLTDRLRTLLEHQEEILKARTRQLEITARMGRIIAAETDLDRLLNTTVEMIRDQLGHYHVQIFLMDDLHQYAVLRASTGAVGRELLARGHKLAVGSHSVIGQVTARGEPVLASDTEHAEYWRPNPLLPETRAELAVPLRLGEQIIGALDIQSTNPNVFDEPTISALQTIADQLAVAIRNAQLFREKESLLSASVQLTQTLTRDGWDSYLQQQRRGTGPLGFRYDLSEVRPLEGAPTGEGENGKGLRLPISLRGEIIGQLEAQLPEGQSLPEEAEELVSQVLDRVALALENARLFEQTQLSLRETNRLYRATQSIASANSIEELAESLLEIAALPTVDRVFLLLVDNPVEGEITRWIRVAGAWCRKEDDPLRDLPEQLEIGAHPLVNYLENLPVGEIEINHVETAPLEPTLKEDLLQMEVQSLAIFALTPVTGQQTLGWLIMHSVSEPEAFAEADIRFLQTVTQQATTALEGLRLFEQTQIRARRLQATNEVTRTASSILNIDILLPLVVQQISDAFGYYHVQIFLLDEAGEWAVLKASTGEVGQELLRRGHKLAVGSQSVIGQVTARGEPVIAHDTDTDPVHRRNELLPDTRAEMALPLRTGDRVIGALDVQSVQPNAFDPEAQAILRSLADQIAVTLENVQLFQEIQERVAELTTINLVAQSVSRADTLEELYDVVTAQLMRTFGARHGYLGLIDRSNIIHLPIFIEGGERIESPEPFPLGEGLTSHVLQSKKVLLINENAMEKAEQMGAKLVGAVPKSLLIVPLMLGNEAIGVISIQDMEKENAFTEAHIRQLSTLAAYIAVKIRNAELLEEAQRRADELGFLFNVTRAAVSSTELDEALSNVVEIVQDEIGGVESAIIYLANIEASVLEPYAAVGYGREVIARQEPVPWGKGLVGTVAARGEPLIIHDTIQHEEAASAEGRTRSAVLVPLQAGGQFSGVLAIESTRPNAFGERELRLLEAASGTLNAVIQNARLLEEVTRANEQLRELDQLKSQFLANMSHELRTPLNSIIGFSRVMLKGIDGPLNDLQTQDLTTIHQSGQHLLGLINNILDMSKIEAGKMEIQPEYVNLEDIVDTVIATGRGLVKDKPIQIFKEVEPGLPMVYGDPVRLRQILLNLVSNAAKFTHEGSITVRVERKDYDPLTGEPPRVQVDVSDTGIGIAKEDMDKLFEAFRQVDGSTTRQVGGTGLGLAISREFVEMHGGRMWVESEPGVGSTFSFTIPLHPPEDTDAEVYASPAYDDGRPIVLAVDDEPGVLDLYRRYLEKEGYAFVALKNANDLLHHVRRVRPSAILLDLNLPGRDGWQAIDDLRTAEDTDDIPIVICSIEDQRQRAEEVGAAGYLTKPIIEDDLLGVLRDVLAEYPTGQTDEQEEPERQTILIVSGQPEYRRVLQEALSNELDCTIQIALTGYESLQILQDGLPSVMLLDADLPDMDGYGLLLALRSQEEFQTLPVILLTKRALSSEELAALGNTCTRYLVKAPRGDGQPISALLDLLAELSA